MRHYSEYHKQAQRKRRIREIRAALAVGLITLIMLAYALANRGDKMKELTLNTYGITVNKPNRLIDQLLAFELGDLNNQETKELLSELEAKGEHELAEKLKRDSLDGYVIDYEELEA